MGIYSHRARNIKKLAVKSRAIGKRSNGAKRLGILATWQGKNEAARYRATRAKNEALASVKAATCGRVKSNRHAHAGTVTGRPGPVPSGRRFSTLSPSAQ